MLIIFSLVRSAIFSPTQYMTATPERLRSQGRHLRRDFFGIEPTPRIGVYALKKFNTDIDHPILRIKSNFHDLCQALFLHLIADFLMML